MQDTLVVSAYQINLGSAQQISVYPSNAIQCLNQAQQNSFYSLFSLPGKPSYQDNSGYAQVLIWSFTTIFTLKISVFYKDKYKDNYE
jgi:hypothetical protein